MYNHQLEVLQSSFRCIEVPSKLLAAAHSLKACAMLLAPSYSSILVSSFSEALSNQSVRIYHATFQQRPLVSIQPNKHAFLGDCEQFRKNIKLFIISLDGLSAPVQDDDLKRSLRHLSELLAVSTVHWHHDRIE